MPLEPRRFLLVLTSLALALPVAASPSPLSLLQNNRGRLPNARAAVARRMARATGRFGRAVDRFMRVRVAAADLRARRTRGDRHTTVAHLEYSARLLENQETTFSQAHSLAVYTKVNAYGHTNKGTEFAVQNYVDAFHNFQTNKTLFNKTNLDLAKTELVRLDKTGGGLAEQLAWSHAAAYQAHQGLSQARHEFGAQVNVATSAQLRTAKFIADRAATQASLNKTSAP